jgi:dipeptidyl-peptidase-4
MKNHLLLPIFLAAFAAALPAQDAGSAKKKLTYAEATKPLSWTGIAPQARIAWDGKHVEWKKDGKAVWFDPKTKAFTEPQAEPESDAKPSEVAATFSARIDGGDLVLQKRTGAASPEANGNGGRRGRRSGGASGGDTETIRLTSDGDAGGKKREAHCDEKGTRASFVRGGNLFVVDAASKDLWQVTNDGSDEMLHGVLDWVYQEEIYGRGDFQGHWWSKQGDHVALLSLDESKVREFTLVDHVPQGFLDKERSVVTEVANYPKVGDPNPRAMLSVVDCANKARVAVDLAAYPEDVLVVRVGWTDDNRLLVLLQDRIQTWAELCSVDLATGKLSKWIREESKSWVNRPEMPRFLQDGTFLWLSERSGYQHIYRYRGDAMQQAITTGEWQVRSIERIDEAKQQIWLEGTKDGATGRHLYRVSFDGSGLVCVTPGVGTHQPELSADASFAIDRWSALDMRPVVRVVDGETGEELARVGEAAMGKAADEYAFVEKVRASIPARDGYMLDATIMLPPFRKAGEKAPIYLPTYSGPDAPTVRDAWLPSSYQIFAAQQGFLVLQVNVRTASGRGHAHISQCYKQLGVQELKDLEDAVAWACKEHGGDSQRVALEGWSYGGFMAAYALTHSSAFQLGLAGAGVYDWRLYDTIYTERYMALPDSNKEGYDRTSVIKSAKDLRGHLVLQHGSMDDNVHLQNTMQLLWELQKAGKQNFELMVYPRSQHGPNPQVAGHVKEFQWRALKKLLDPAWKPE